MVVIFCLMNPEFSFENNGRSQWYLPLGLEKCCPHSLVAALQVAFRFPGHHIQPQLRIWFKRFAHRPLGLQSCAVFSVSEHDSGQKGSPMASSGLAGEWTAEAECQSDFLSLRGARLGMLHNLELLKIISRQRISSWSRGHQERVAFEACRKCALRKNSTVCWSKWKYRSLCD